MRKVYTSFLLILVGGIIAVAQNVGIGTSNPQSRLSINGNSAIGSNYSAATAPADGLLIEGNVGIGTVAPNSKLHILDNSSDTVLIVQPGAGKYAAKFDGLVDVTGYIKNTGNLFNGSVAVNDGLTVGDLSGAQCSPNTATTCSFSYIDSSGSFQIDPNEPAWATSNSPSCNTGQCRAITNFNLSATFFDFSFLAIKVDIYVQNQFLYKVLVADALDSSWVVSFNTNSFNGQDPSTVSNWSVLMAGYDPSGDSDRCEEYTGTISYNWADSASVSNYAAFGEIRASGTLYANSVNAYGDVAEFFEITAEHRLPEAGDIVSISPTSPQAFSLTNRANDPLLAGVISENPSVYINSPDMGEPIALTGRVKVKVNAAGGAIRPGDPITSSSTLAVGMKQNNQGTIVGYALEAYDGKDGEVGKIWILLDKGHYEKVSALTPVYKVDDVMLGGIKITGSHKVDSHEKEVFLAWESLVHETIPTDVEFDDLLVDLNAFGGAAMLSVDRVDATGIYIGITKRAKGFKGFYYNIDLVSPELYKQPAEEAISKEVVPDDLEDFTALYHKWENTAAELIQLSGRRFDGLGSNMSSDDIKMAKQAVLDAWASADSKKYAQYVMLGKKLQVMLQQKEIAAAVCSMENL